MLCSFLLWLSFSACTAQGWVDSVRELLNIYLHPHNSCRRQLPVFDYSLIRAAGSPIKGFGGTSQGVCDSERSRSRIVLT